MSVDDEEAPNITVFRVNFCGKFVKHPTGEITYEKGNVLILEALPEDFFKELRTSDLVLDDLRIFYKLPFEGLDKLKLMNEGSEVFKDMCEAAFWTFAMDMFLVPENEEVPRRNDSVPQRNVDTTPGGVNVGGVNADGVNAAGDNAGEGNACGGNAGGVNVGEDNADGVNVGEDNADGINGAGDNAGGGNATGDNADGVNVGGDNAAGDNAGGDMNWGDHMNAAEDNDGGDKNSGEGSRGGRKKNACRERYVGRGRYAFEQEARVEENVADFVDEEVNDVCHDSPPASDCEEDQSYETWRRGSGELRIRMVFESIQEFKEAVMEYCLLGGWNVKFTRWGSVKSSAVCSSKTGGNRCPWRIYCSYEASAGQWMVKSYQEEHSCFKDGTCSLLKSIHV